MFGCGKAFFALAFLIATPVTTMAQTTDNQPAPSSQAPQSQPATQAPPVQPAAQPQPDQQLMKPEQLEALVAPIALYPDELLANVLAAATYPLEAVQADRWVKANKSLKGDALKAAVDKQAWDDSIKALASTPDVLAMMSDKIDWTKNLGDAVLAQQADVMDAIQRLRAKAQARDKLVTNKQQKVSVQRQENKDVIVIEQAQPETVYVPYYDPATVYGEWPYPDYPAYYFGYPSYIGAGVIAAGLGVRHRLGDRTLGQLLGRRRQLGKPQPLRQSLQPDKQRREQLAAQPGPSPGREIQQRQCRQPLRQQHPEGGSQQPHGFPRARWPAGTSPRTGSSGRRRPGRRSCG